MNTGDIVNLSRRRFVTSALVSVAGLTLGILPGVRAGNVRPRQKTLVPSQRRRVNFHPTPFCVSTKMAWSP